MPLSDHEQKLLDQIEQALYADDPKFAASVRTARTKSRTRRAVLLSAIGVVGGLALVLVGLVTNIIALSVVGFVFVVSACGWAAQMLHGRKEDVTASAAAAPRGASERHGGGLRNRMEDRLRRRFDEN